MRDGLSESAPQLECRRCDISPVDECCGASRVAKHSENSGIRTFSRQRNDCDDGASEKA